MIATTISLLLLAASAQAQQPAPSYPLLEQLSAKLVQKYQTSSCQQLAHERAAPPSPQKEMMKGNLGQQLQRDVQMRAVFVNRVRRADRR